MPFDDIPRAGIAPVTTRHYFHSSVTRCTDLWIEPFDLGILDRANWATGDFVVAWAASRWPGGATQAAGWFFVAGILVFSGSLYTLVLTGQRWLGAGYAGLWHAAQGADHGQPRARDDGDCG